MRGRASWRSSPALRWWRVRRRGHLAGRLDGHLRAVVTTVDLAWWSPPARWRHDVSGRDRRSGRRAVALAQVVERLGLLVALGHAPAAAVGRVAADSEGPLATEAAWLDSQLRAGARLAPAVAAWARRVRCPEVGLLAAALRGCSSADEVAAAIDGRAAALADRALAHRLRLVRWKARVVWLAGVVTASLSAAVVLP